MEFLVLMLLFASALLIFFKPEKKKAATLCGTIGVIILVIMEFYVNAWVVVPVGNF